MFRGARLKVKRAYKHIGELEAWVADINKVNADTARRYKEDNPSRADDHVMVQRSAAYVDCVPPIIGDAVHCLRSALDFVASSIVRAGGDDPERPPMYFPAGDTRKGFVSTVEFGRIQRVAPKLADVLADVITPYKAGNDNFWALNRLDRTDKHRTLIITMANERSFGIAIREDQEDDPPPAGPGTIYFIATHKRADGTVLSQQRPLRPGTKAFVHNQNNGYQTVDVCFGKGEIFEDQSVIPTLKQLAELVSKTIDILEAHTS